LNREFAFSQLRVDVNHQGDKAFIIAQYLDLIVINGLKGFHLIQLLAVAGTRHRY
jgi:hypothetical protein